MKTSEDLYRSLRQIDGRGYKAYKDIAGTYHFAEWGFTLLIDYVQGDPFASPSRLRVILPQEEANFPQFTFENESREIATRDFITRAFAKSIRRVAKGSRGSGKSGRIHIDTPGQEILERTSVFIDSQNVEVRFTVGLPAFGRRIAGREAQTLLLEEIPEIIQTSLFYRNLNAPQLDHHWQTNEDADTARRQLFEKNLVAFISNDALLPRASGIDPRPLASSEAILFQSPESMEVSLNLPHAGTVKGMGIQEGITLIVGGGFHGKSTLLDALEKGIYNHIPGDGRERVICRPMAAKIRAEDGRRIEKTDISPFINNLPMGKSTQAFCTDNASGSTSQAANITEALEAGASLVLVDEDTSATNFMIRDYRMQRLIHHEPITPFVDRIRPLYEEHGVSTILVMGGSGDYFDIADTIIALDNYIPFDVTSQAQEIAKQAINHRQREGNPTFGSVPSRTPLKHSIDASKGRKERNIKAYGTREIQFGMESIEITSQEQLVDESQTRAIGDAIYYATRYMNGSKTMGEILDCVFQDINKKGWNIIGSSKAGDYASFRPLELAAAINRLRSLKIKE